MPETPANAHFTDASLAFLRTLQANNTRDWFQEHKAVYEAEVRAPLRRLVERLAPAMLGIDPELDVHGPGAVSRIMRDTRFSRDKSPYRVNQWIAFKRRRKDWTTWPAFFMECDPDGYRYGMGYYAATPATMQAIRARAEAKPGEAVQAMERLSAAGYAIEGERYKRPRLPEGLAEPVLELYRRKSVHVVINRPLDADFLSPKLAGVLEPAFGAAAPLYRFLIQAAEAEPR